MDVTKSYHDKEIIGVYLNKTNKILSLTTSDNEKIKFNNVIQIELNYFSDQNIIFDILKYDLKSVPNSLIEDYPFLKNERLNKDWTCYVIDSSTGLLGVIVCDH